MKLLIEWAGESVVLEHVADHLLGIEVITEYLARKGEEQ